MQMQSSPIPRRQFIKTSLAGAGLAAATRLGWADSETSAAKEGSRPIPKAILGRTGERVSRLGIGCAWFQLKEIGPDDVRKVFERARQLGVNYLDVAANYGNPREGFSEVKMGPALQGIRDDFFLVTKTEHQSRDGTWRSIERSLKRMKTDHLDLVHLHNFGLVDRFPDLKLLFGKSGALGALREAKRQKVVRFIGASGHLFPSRFHAILDTGQVDVLMNAVNFVARHVYDFEDKVWSRARQEGLGLVAMKVLGGNQRGGFRLPSDFYDKAIRYVLSIPALSTAVVGMKNVEELDRAARVVRNFSPLTDEESQALALEGLRLAATPGWRAAYGTPVT